MSGLEIDYDTAYGLEAMREIKPEFNVGVFPKIDRNNFVDF